MTVLAERYYGDRNKWEWIAKANPLVDPAAMKVGASLVIPSAAAAAPTRPAAGVGGTNVGGGAGSNRAASSGTHEVQAGETLYSIARRHYGDASLWERIYEANRSTIGTDPAALKVGMRLALPPKPAA